MDAEKVKAALEALKNQDAEAALVILEEMIASAAGGDADTSPDSTEALAETPAAEEEDPEKKPEMQAAAALSRALGIKSPGDAAAFVERHKELSAKVARIEADRKALEDDERKGLVGDLVKLGFETPATAWEDAEKRLPCKRLAAEPIDDLRDRVKTLRASRPKGLEGVKRPEGDGEVAKLSAKEVEAAKKLGITPQEFANRKASAISRA